MNEEMLLRLGDIALYGAAFAAFLMLTLYLFRSAWYTSRAGIALTSWMGATAGVLAFNAFSVWLMGDFPARPYVRLTLYTALFLLNVRWVFLIFRVQNDARRKRNHDRQHQTEGE